MFTKLLQTVLSFNIYLSTNFQIGGQLEDRLPNWRTWRTNCQIGGRPPERRTVVLYDVHEVRDEVRGEHRNGEGIFVKKRKE